MASNVIHRAGHIVGGTAVNIATVDSGVNVLPLLPEPAPSKLLPGYGGSRVLLDRALTTSFHQAVPLLIGLSWLAGLALAVVVTYQRTTRPARTPPPVVGWRPALGTPGVYVLTGGAGSFATVSNTVDASIASSA